MYTYIRCLTPGMTILIEGESKTIIVGETIKGIIEFNTQESPLTVQKLNIALMGTREKGRNLKLDRFNVNHNVDIDANSLLKFPFQMTINKDKWDSSMSVMFDMKVKTNIGDYETSSSFTDVIHQTDPTA